MNPRRLFFFVLLLALSAWGLKGVLLKSDAQLNGNTESIPQDSLFAIPSGSVAQIAIHLPFQRGLLQLSKEPDGRWLLTEPIQDLADSSSMRVLSDTLLKARTYPIRKEWENRPLKEMGLEPPQMSVDVFDVHGNKHSLLMGAMDSTGERRIASYNGKRFLVGPALLGLLSRPPMSWRSSLLFFGASALRKLEFQASPEGEHRTFEKRGPLWYSQHPVSGLLSNQAAGALTRMLGSRALEFPEDYITEEQVNWIQEGQRWTLHHANQKSMLYYRGGLVLVEGRPYLFPVAAKDFMFAFLKESILLSQRMTALSPEEVISAEIRLGAKRPQFRRRSSGWSPVGAKEGAPNVNLQLERLVEEVCSLERLNAMPRPESTPIASLVLSKSQTPLVRSGLQLDLWLISGEQWILGMADEDQVVPAPQGFPKLIQELALQGKDSPR